MFLSIRIHLFLVCPQTKLNIVLYYKFESRKMNSYFVISNKPIYKHILFWIIVFLFYTTSARERFDSVEEVVITYFFHIVFQLIIAYTILYFILPDYKRNNNIIKTVLVIGLLFFIINILYVSIRMFFLEKTYPNCYETFLEKHGHLTYEERIFNLKAIFFHLPIFYLQPLFFLIALTFYERQYKISKTNEQRKMVELKALKQQLNPHFLFNTLNNLYALAVEKSDKAPEVIEKLSNILDYMLYGSDKKFVSIQKEVDLIENYLALEQVRYDDRVLVSFKNSITENLTIAPLLLLTFVENAFKHGVSQELKLATIKINLATEKENIIFNIFNTKPSTNIQKKSASKKPIGLINIEQQLKLLYPNTHDLKIEETPESFSVQLKLKKQQDV